MGVHKKIASPEILWQHFLDYRDEVKENPKLVVDWVGKDADRVNRPKERPLTFIGFQNYLDEMDVITDVTDYFENKDDRYADFVRICTRIGREIKDDQITGGMCGIYNTSITQRLNGLTEKTELKVATEQPLFPEDARPSAAPPEADDDFM
jgi:DNA-packaging protein gp3